MAQNKDRSDVGGIVVISALIAFSGALSVGFATNGGSGFFAGISIFIFSIFVIGLLYDIANNLEQICKKLPGKPK